MGNGQLRVGVVGAGWFASRRHLPDLKAREDVTVVAVCRRDPERLRQVADHFGVLERYASYEAMLAGADLDAVVVATPHALHYDQARTALEHGLHVLLEKPMALKAQEADMLVELASENSRVLTVALNPPFWRHTCYARDAIGRGEIGTLESVSIHWIGNVEAVFGRGVLPDEMPGVVKPTLYRGDVSLSGGGLLMDVGAHLVSELLWVTGLAPEGISALMDDSALDMRASVQTMLAGQVPGGILAIGDSRCSERRIQNLYLGSEGTLRIDGMPFRVAIERPGKAAIVVHEDEMPNVPGPVDVFVDEIREKKGVALPGTHGAAVVQVVETAYESARTGRQVVLGKGA